MNNSILFHHRYYVAAHWRGFHDSHSEIAYYQVYSGSQPNSSDIVSPFVVDASQTSVAISLPTPLTHNTTVFTTLVAFNGAGLNAVVITDGVEISAEAPAFVSNPFIDVYWAGALLNNTQYDNSLMRLVSNVTDHSNTVIHYVWAVYSARQVTLPVHPLISRLSHSVTLSELHLSDGDTYHAEVEACNAAGLCSKAKTVDYLVDASPPIDGYFAVKTSSVEQISGRVETMTWRNSPILENSRIRLYFVGFSDPHSGIRRYYCSVGTAYSTSDLTSGFQLLQPQQINTQGTYLANVTLTRELNLNEILYISLWAENGVGLNSRVVQGSFSLTSISSLDGILELRRTANCSIDTCSGHCTCAPRGDLCDLPSTCHEIEIEDLPQDMRVTVTDIVPQMLYPATSGSTFTASSNKLAARWNSNSPNTVQWFEWSVGIKGTSAGTGLLNTAGEQIWFNAGTNLSAIFSVSPDYPLLPGMTYVFYVCAWYNSTSYAVFSSTGVTIDPVGPQIVEGFSTREVDMLGSTADVDHISSRSTINLTWQSVFQQTVRNYDIKFEMAIGDTPAGKGVLRTSI